MDKDKKDKNQLGCLIALVIGLGVVLLCVIVLFIFVLSSETDETTANNINAKTDNISCSVSLKK